MSAITLFDLNKSLFERIVSEDHLAEAYRAVRRNKGAPGIDGVSVEDFGLRLDQELGQLHQELMNWTYEPKPVRRVEIPKPGGEGVRLLGVPCIRDRVVQASIKAALEPIFEAKFSEHSYGFRPGRSQRQAVEAAQRIVSTGKEFVVDIDLSKFFDRVQHDRLIYRLGLEVPDKRVLRLIGQTLRSGVMVEGVRLSTEEGTTQGSPLSPLLSNVVLDELDKELERRGLEFCRFADDCNVFVGSEKAAERVMATVTKFIEKRLRLVVNQEKSKVARSKFVKFLGMTIITGTVAISAQSMSRAMNKVRDLTPRGTNQTIEQTMSEVNRWYVGWSNYYGMTQYPSQLAAIEAHVRRRLRSRIVGQQKRRRHLFEKLVKRGVRRGFAAKTVYSNRGRWYLSHSRAVERAYPNQWFTETIGQKLASTKNLPHWFDVKTWIKLT
jgi:group II intron reverse transcriptase/maturase